MLLLAKAGCEVACVCRATTLTSAAAVRSLPPFDVIICQEHWLLSDQLYKLNDMIDDFQCIPVSAMDDVCSIEAFCEVAHLLAWKSLFEFHCVIIFSVLSNVTVHYSDFFSFFE